MRTCRAVFVGTMAARRMNQPDDADERIAARRRQAAIRHAAVQPDLAEGRAAARHQQAAAFHVGRP